MHKFIAKWQPMQKLNILDTVITVTDGHGYTHAQKSNTLKK